MVRIGKRVAQAHPSPAVLRKGEVLNRRRKAHEQRAWHVADVLCKKKRSKGLVPTLVGLSALLQNHLAEVRRCHCGPALLIVAARRNHVDAAEGEPTSFKRPSRKSGRISTRQVPIAPGDWLVKPRIPDRSEEHTSELQSLRH